MLGSLGGCKQILNNIISGIAVKEQTHSPPKRSAETADTSLVVYNVFGHHSIVITYVFREFLDIWVGTFCKTQHPSTVWAFILANTCHFTTKEHQNPPKLTELYQNHSKLTKLYQNHSKLTELYLYMYTLATQFSHKECIFRISRHRAKT